MGARDVEVVDDVEERLVPSRALAAGEHEPPDAEVDLALAILAR